MKLQSLFLLAGSLVLLATTSLPADEPAAAKKPAATQEQLEKDFADAMSGVVMTGHFTVTGQKADQSPKEEKYWISKVTKVKDNTWLFQTRIKYNEHDLTLPLPLEVKWAGDTPMITLTDVGVPGLGTFTARVLIFRNQYAGTWSGGDHGGHLYGEIAKDPAPATTPKEATPKEKKEASPKK